MPKRVSSKIAGYVKPNQLQSQNQERLQPNDQAVIADMTKGFLQAQATMNNTTQQNNSQEVVDLLNKINSNLQSLQNSLTAGSSNQGQLQQSISSQSAAQNQQAQQSQGQQLQGQQSGNMQSESAMNQELRNLFSLLLQNTSDQNGAVSPTEKQGSPQQGQEQDQTADSENKNQQTKPSNIAVQTAAQVLAQAQYELSNELEASLKKLKQVISESEKIAAKISNLLGEENSPKQ